jgi:hypothetical protein
MRALIARRLTYANVMATVAVFLALGGVGYAVTIPSNSVGTSQLRPRAVTNAKLANNSVNARNVIRNTIGTSQLGPFQVRARNFGPITFREASVTVPAAPGGAGTVSSRPVTRVCNSNEKAISAGTRWTNGSTALPDNTNVSTVEVNYQSRTGFGVFGATARGANATSSPHTFTIQVQCLARG